MWLIKVKSAFDPRKSVFELDLGAGCVKIYVLLWLVVLIWWIVIVRWMILVGLVVVERMWAIIVMVGSSFSKGRHKANCK